MSPVRWISRSSSRLGPDIPLRGRARAADGAGSRAPSSDPCLARGASPGLQAGEERVADRLDHPTAPAARIHARLAVRVLVRAICSCEDRLARGTPRRASSCARVMKSGSASTSPGTASVFCQTRSSHARVAGVCATSRSALNHADLRLGVFAASSPARSTASSRARSGVRSADRDPAPVGLLRCSRASAARQLVAFTRQRRHRAVSNIADGGDPAVQHLFPQRDERAPRREFVRDVQSARAGRRGWRGPGRSCRSRRRPLLGST